MILKMKTALVWDNGLFVSLAVTLTKHFGTVYYFCPWVIGFPTSQLMMIGDGYPGVRRVLSPWSLLDDIDIFIFPDVFEADIQEYLVSIGKRVWGCRSGAELENDRVKAKEISEKVGIGIGPYNVVRGMDGLRRYLKSHDDQYVKISLTRGDFETFHAPSYEQIKSQLDEIAYQLGPRVENMRFVCEDNTGPAVEIGYDGYTIDGRFPRKNLLGVEAKDTAYVAKVVNANAAQSVQDVNTKLSPVLEGYEYRGFFSTEIRCIEDESGSCLIDTCSRMGSPPGELYQMMLKNIGEIIWHGASGTLIEPEFAGKWGAEAILTSDAAEKNWVQVSYPDSVQDNIKLRYCTMINGKQYVIPQANGMKFLGAVVAYGGTAKEAIERCREIAEQVEAVDLKTGADALDSAYEDLNKLLADARPPTATSRRANELMAAGRISKRQYDEAIGDD